LVLVKKKEEMPRREVSKRRLARWQQQRKRQRFIRGLGILVIAAVLGVTGVGWYLSQYQPRWQTVIRVNDTEFNMDYYIKALEFHTEGQPVQFIQFLADQVETSIQQNELVRQKALELGFSVSDKEVDEELKSRARPVNQASRDIVRAEMLVNRLRDEYFEQQVPVFAEQRHILAMFLESESQVNEVRTRLESGEDFAKLASELSLDDFSKTAQGDLGWRPKGVLTILLDTPIVDEYAYSSEVGVLSQPIYDEERTKGVGYWIVKVLEKAEEVNKAKVFGIMLSSEEEARRVKERLEAGDDFFELAGEVSEHEQSREDGGNLGWLSPGETSPAFDEFIFNHDIELGAVSEPIFDDTVATEGGYWLLKVLNRQEKPAKADVQVMLLSSEEEAHRVKGRLEADEDFGELAKELSQHDESKGDGGKVVGVTPGMMSAAIDEFIFDPDVESGTLSQPIRDDTVVTRGGYWLLKVVDIDDNRKIGDDNRDLLKNKALNDWLLALWNDPENKVESYLDDQKMQWAVSQVTKG
jgi:parvulin-like peptidyl-prolyl isomerase